MKIRPLIALILLLSVAFSSAAQTSDVFQRRNIKTKMLAVARWQLAHPKHQLYDWTNGAFFAGIFAAYQTTRDPELMRVMMEMGEKNEWRPGPRFDHADDLTAQARVRIA